MKNLLLSSLILIFLISSSFADSIKQKLENQYIDSLKSWIKNGSRNPNDVKTSVQVPCSKLVMLLATPKEQAEFVSRSKIDEYDYRAGFCMSAVVNNVWPNQPGFTKDFRKKACREKIPLIKRVCKEFV
ncbi:hypothetical protein OAL80_02225 [Pelagibacteraceae bacterium]|nr:hypothetical protein [Pelagibacteraceae bacterium]